MFLSQIESNFHAQLAKYFLYDNNGPGTFDGVEAPFKTLVLKINKELIKNNKLEKSCC